MRALMFVHQGMDVENQWEKAVAALESMSNLEIALVWRRLSESVPVDDFKMHSEYKCLFKRAVREAEGRAVESRGLYHKMHGHAHDFDDAISEGGSVHYEYTPYFDPRRIQRLSRDSSGISKDQVQAYSEDEKHDIYSKYLDLILENGLYAPSTDSAMKDAIFLRVPKIKDMDEGSRTEYYERLIETITADSMSDGMRTYLLEKLSTLKQQ